MVSFTSPVEPGAAGAGADAPACFAAPSAHSLGSFPQLASLLLFPHLAQDISHTHHSFSTVLNRVTASLCQAVTEEPASAQMLERIERANLFLVPLDDERRWYRLHDLFREALLARLHATRPEMVPLLHQRAAHWYKARGEWPEAIAHALAVLDFSYAARLMELAAEQPKLLGEVTTVYHRMIALPDAVLREHARLALTAALQMLQSNQYSIENAWQNTRVQVEHLMARIDALLLWKTADAFSEAEAAVVCQRINVLRLF